MMKKTLFLLLLLLCGSLMGCQKDAQALPAEELAFFADDFHIDAGFAFDDLSLLDSYEDFRERMELIEAEPVIIETETYGKQMTTVTYYYVTVDELPGVAGDIEYCFFGDQFMSGEMLLTFQEYADAVAFVEGHMEQLSQYQSEEARQQMEEAGSAYMGYYMYESREDSAVSACYVDENNVYIALQAYPSVDGTGEVTVFFGENLDYTRPGAKEQSQYFEFAE